MRHVGARAVIERVRDSLFFIPALYIIGGAALALLTDRLDGALFMSDAPWLLPATLEGARTILGAIAGATITVAALVFSITAVSVQLAATQYSPRVLQGFLRDRFQQSIVGIVVGTFTYALVALATADPLGDPEDVPGRWSATAGTVLGVASVLAIVAFIDHVTRRIRIDDTIRRISFVTASALERLFPPEEPHAESTDLDLDERREATAVRASRSGWVQEVDVEDLLARLPPEALARLDVRVGTWATKGTVVMKVWGREEVEVDPDRLADTITIGTTRSVDQDPTFGIRQLVDIALRALSPGVNDPTTAADVVRHLVTALRPAFSGRARRRVYAAGDKRVFLPQELDRSDLIRSAFTEIRLNARRQPFVAATLVDALMALRELADPEGETSEAALTIDSQIDLLLEEVERWGLSDPDRRSIDDALARHGLDKE